MRKLNKRYYFNAVRKSIINNKKSNKIMAFDISKVPFIDEAAVFALEDRVIVYPDPAEEITTGGIIIPDTAKEKLKKGTVILVGPMVGDTRLVAGMRIHYGKHSGQDWPFGGHNYQAVRPSEGIVGMINVGEEKDYVSFREAEETPAEETEKPQRATMAV